MKPHAEMNEGPEALKRFEDTMKAIFSKRKKGILPKSHTSPEGASERQKPQNKSK
jgi:hypothetical protein